MKREVKRARCTTIELPCGVDLWCKECDEQVEMVDAERVGDNVESLNVHDAAHVQKAEHHRAHPSDRRVRCGQVE